MLLRRVIDHVSKQNWTAVGIDFAIVVIGVFVGLQVTSWNESRIAASRADSYYERLVDELKSELESRAARVRYYETTRAHAEAALDALQLAANRRDERFLVDVYQATQRWTYALQRTTYDELISTGIVAAIPDVEIRSRLAALYVNLAGSALTQMEPTPFRDELRRHMPHPVQSAIRENCGDRYHFPDDGAAYLSLPETCAIGLSDTETADAIEAIEDYTDLSKDLARHIAIIDSKLSSLSANSAPIEEVIELLRTR